MLPTVTRKRSAKPSVSIVGPGSLGTGLAVGLWRAGYEVRYIVTRAGGKGGIAARTLSRRVKGKHVELGTQRLDTDIVWLTVPDDSIEPVAMELAESQSWRRTVVFHSSGALSSEELSALWEKGALVASVHPMMTFVRGVKASWHGVAFAIEGDDEALWLAESIARDLGGRPLLLEKRNKALYHAFGSFASPMVIALMAAMEEVAEEAGIPKESAKHIVAPLLAQTLQNYMRGDAAGAFSGPLARGDVQTVRRHLAQLMRLPEARDVYLALARAAIKMLPVKNRAKLEGELKLR